MLIRTLSIGVLLQGEFAKGLLVANVVGTKEFGAIVHGSLLL